MNQGPLAHESSTLPTELQEPCYGGGGNFENQAADLAPVLGLVFPRTYTMTTRSGIELTTAIEIVLHDGSRVAHPQGTFEEERSTN